MDFWEDVLNLDPDEVARLFETWACSRHQSKSFPLYVQHKLTKAWFTDAGERDTLLNVRKQVTRMIQSGLRAYILILLKQLIDIIYREYTQQL